MTRQTKTCRKKINLKSENRFQSISIFTDEFLDLCREQKKEIRHLKQKLNELNDLFKFKDAQQEEIRLNNKKLHKNIQDIQMKNDLILQQFFSIEKQIQFKNQNFTDDWNQLIQDLIYQINDRHFLEKLTNFFSKSSQLNSNDSSLQ